MLADTIRHIVFLAGCSALVAGQPLCAAVASTELRQPLPQQPLAAQGQGVAVIFIGGFGDEISGIMPQVQEVLPSLAELETRAYYHWHAGSPQSSEQGAVALAAHIRDYRRRNPAADVVLIGHSMGASMALRAAHLLRAPEGRVFLVTLDPADRSYRPQRPESVVWWGNAYVVHSLSNHDYIAVLGGRWNVCRGADLNLCFDGRQRDEAGYHYIHDNALSLLMSRNRGAHPSIFDTLRGLLVNKGKKDSPTGAATTGSPLQAPAETKR